MPLLAAAPRDFPPPAPSPPPSITRSFTMTSVLYFFCPDSLSSQELVRSAPSMYTVRPFLRYSPAISAVRPKAVRLCHSVWSCQFPSLSFLRSLVAKLNAPADQVNEFENAFRGLREVAEAGEALASQTCSLAERKHLLTNVLVWAEENIARIEQRERALTET